MTFKEKLQADMQAVFCDAGRFAEEVEYWPLGVEANAITLNAIVDRGQPAPWFVEGALPILDYQITVPKSDSGITSITKGKDMFKVAAEPGGGTYVTVRIDQILFQDEGGWTLSGVGGSSA